jgi:hypothetical protein
MLKKIKHKIAVGCLGALIVVIFVIYSAFAALDSFGWIPHFSRVEVRYPEKDWELGEYRLCSATKNRASSDVALDCRNNLSEPMILREMDATLWGKLRITTTAFTCQRNPTRIVCHVTKDLGN